MRGVRQIPMVAGIAARRSVVVLRFIQQVSLSTLLELTRRIQRTFMARTKTNGASAQSTANIGFEAQLWLTAWLQHFIHHVSP
jgi:hypothetical protein